MDARPKVAVFVTNFGAPSQTFVYDQLRSHRRYAPEVFTWRHTEAQRFPFEPVHCANVLYGATAVSPAFFARFQTAGFSLVHAHFGPGAVYALPYAQRFGLPLVVTFHGYDVPLLGSRRRYLPEWWPYAIAGRAALRRMTVGLCVSNDLRDRLVAQGVPESKLRVFRLGIDLSAFRTDAKPDDRFQVAMIGRFVEKKGFEHGLRAFAAFVRTGRPGRLVVVGEGPLDARLRSLATALAIDDHVEWRGWLSPRGVAAVLAQSNVLLVPSVEAGDGDCEGCPMIVQEASASGTVVAATRHGGIADAVVHGETGLLVDERDEAAMTRHLVALHDDRALRDRLARAAIDKTRRERDLDHRIGSLEAEYDDACRVFEAERARKSG